MKPLYETAPSSETTNENAPARSVNPNRLMLTCIGSRLLLLILLLWLALFRLPKAEATFDELGIALPAITQAALMLGNFIASYWWLLFVPVGALIGIEAFIVRRLAAHDRVFLARLLMFLVTTMLLGLSAFLVIGIMITQQEIAKQLG